MGLKKYNRMRDFTKTKEPKGSKARKSAKPIFVIQEHHATRLHYDFRLEAEGVLKSWAVTKEPSLDPTIKRLAIEVEDHPIDYANFEGDIPHGQYGGGHVEIWDEGIYEPIGADSVSESIESGRLKFRLSGKRMNGVFNLIRTRGKTSKPHWLLIKSKDEAAKAPKQTQAQSAKISVLTRGSPEKVELTNLDKPMFPEADVTKGDILVYYDRIALRLLPFLKDRPITLERLPEGLAGENAPHFWQKNTPKYYPAWIPRLQLPSETGKPVNYVLVNNKETLLYLVNQGAITFHVWASRLQNLDRPDFVLFDLDPGKASFADVVTLAKDLHRLLKKRGIESFVKTSGKTGLHVFTKWTENGDHDQARDWALTIAGELVSRNPAIATTERSKAKRNGRVYVDVMQNARGHHAVPPYVLRAVPHATVSTPLEWKELTAKLNPKRFDLRTVFNRFRGKRKDPMQGLSKEGP